MQNDGNLVYYNGSSALWASNTVQQSVQETKFEGGDSLHSGHKLHHHQKLTSQNGRFTAVMQGDGNFVVYDGTRALWATATTDGHYVVNQGDDNLVIYDRFDSAKWASGTNGRGNGRSHLVMQNDGNLVYYNGSSPLWASNTVQSSGGGGGEHHGRLEGRLEGRHHGGGGGHRDTLDKDGRLHGGEELRSADGRYRAVMQQDGNFVVYGGSALWASNTVGHNGHWVVMQGDHNLVVYDKHNKALWSSQTDGRGHGNSRLVVQNDGNLVIYDGHNKALWASNTAGRY